MLTFPGGMQVLLKRNTTPPPLPTSGTVRKVKPEDLAPKVNKGKICVFTNLLQSVLCCEWTVT